MAAVIQFSSACSYLFGEFLIQRQYPSGVHAVYIEQLCAVNFTYFCEYLSALPIHRFYNNVIMPSISLSIQLFINKIQTPIYFIITYHHSILDQFIG